MLQAQEINPLYYLTEIDNYQSISLAAEHLHISQPALSKAIKNLEKSLNLTLLDRNYRGVSLTEDGKKIVELAKKGFEYFDQIENFSKEKNNLLREDISLNDLTIYTNPAYSNIVLASLLKDFNFQTAHHPLELKNLSPEVDMFKLIKDNPSAVCFGIVNENFIIPSELSIKVLNKSKSYVLCAKNFPHISPDKNSISFQELLKVPLIITETSFYFQDTLLNILKSHGTPAIKAIAPDFPSTVHMVASGLGVSIVNKLYQNDTIKDFRYIPIRNAPKFVLALIYHKNISPEKVAKLADLVKSYL